jgi:dTMP kinase
MPVTQKKFFGRKPPEIKDAKFAGRLFVIEGADGSGRSTQIAILSQWLEAQGFAVRHMGLRRSTLVAEELEDAKEGNVLTHTTLSLFYATDFFDQQVHDLVPALRAGLIVLADRYVFTLMARAMVRGADLDWVRNLYSNALVPDAVFYISVSARQLVERNFQKNSTLDYWESGMDLGLSRDMFDSASIAFSRNCDGELGECSASQTGAGTGVRKVSGKARRRRPAVCGARQ